MKRCNAFVCFVRFEYICHHDGNEESLKMKK